ncbi:hypothetical protein ACWJJH_06980 [Endozoicomonadaceae bacterium StTr2]
MKNANRFLYLLSFLFLYGVFSSSAYSMISCYGAYNPMSPDTPFAVIKIDTNDRRLTVYYSCLDSMYPAGSVELEGEICPSVGIPYVFYMMHKLTSTSAENQYAVLIAKYPDGSKTKEGMISLGMPSIPKAGASTTTYGTKSLKKEIFFPLKDQPIYLVDGIGGDSDQTTDTQLQGYDLMSSVTPASTQLMASVMPSTPVSSGMVDVECFDPYLSLLPIVCEMASSMVSVCPAVKLDNAVVKVTGSAPSFGTFAHETCGYRIEFSESFSVVTFTPEDQSYAPGVKLVKMFEGAYRAAAASIVGGKSLAPSHVTSSSRNQVEEQQEFMTKGLLEMIVDSNAAIATLDDITDDHWAGVLQNLKLYGIETNWDTTGDMATAVTACTSMKSSIALITEGHLYKCLNLDANGKKQLVTRFLEYVKRVRAK